MSSKDLAWYEDENLKKLYIKAASNAFTGYTSPINIPKTTWIGTNSLIDYINYLGAFLDEDEKRVLIIVDPDLRKIGERVAERLRTLRQIESRLFDKVEPEVPRYTIDAGVEVCKDFEPKVIIAVGGGSAIDTAKMIFLVYEKPEINFNTMMAPSFVGLRKKILHFTAIPTTSGTGSEATFISVVTDTNRDPPKKTSVAAYELCPDFAILHPDFVKTMPRWLTIATGVDAFCHAMGTYTLTMSNFFHDMSNLKAIELILKYFPRAIKRLNDIEARENMQKAAWLASGSIAGIEHGFGQAFGAIFHVHHGISCVVFLFSSIAYQSKVSNRFFDLAKLFGIQVENRPRSEILKELLINLRLFLQKVDCPLSIQEIKDPRIDRKDYLDKMDDLVHYTFNDYCTLSSTRKLDKKNIRRICQLAYENKLDDLMDLHYK
jgi:alcohol dehydrogenase class IV